MISLIVAMSKDGVIGKDNKLPWHLPEDLKHFKNVTLGKPIVMGRKTFASIGKALPGRRNIVLTRNKAWQAEGVEVVHSFNQVCELLSNESEFFVIGGAELFREAWKSAKKIYLTLIDEKIAGDVYFPFLKWEQEFRITKQSEKLQSSSGLRYQFIEASRSS